MRRLILIPSIVAVFAVFVVAAYPVLSQYGDAQKQDTKKIVVIQSEVTGMVSFIKGDYLKVVDQKGEYYLIRADSVRTLKGIRIGDNVNVKIRDGMAVSIKKVQIEPDKEV
jgi:hypothetical protein